MFSLNESSLGSVAHPQLRQDTASNLSLPEMTPVLQRTLVGPVIGLDLLVPPDGPTPSQSGSMGDTSNYRQEV